MSTFPKTKKKRKAWAPSYVPKITSPAQEYILTQIWHSLGKYDYTIEDVKAEPGRKMRVVHTLMRKKLIDIVGPQEKLNLTILGLQALKYDQWMHNYTSEELDRKWQDMMKYQTETLEALTEMESIYHWQWQCAIDKGDEKLIEFFRKKWLEAKEKLKAKKQYATAKKYRES